MKDFTDKVAVVTGGAGGIGRALAEELVAEGCKLVVADVQQDLLDETAATLGAKGEVLTVRTDVTDPDSVRELADLTYGRFGACHLLFNNAGVGAPSAAPWESTANDWKWLLGVNVLGVVHGTQSFVPRMLESGEPGHIVNTSSGNGGIAPLPTAAPYAATKAAVSAFTECLAAELKAQDSNLSASIFYPSGGLLKTNLWESERTRPTELTREVPRTSEAMTVAKLEASAAARGHSLPWQDLNELARVVIEGLRAEQFIFMIGLESIGPTLRARADYLERGELPPPAGH